MKYRDACQLSQESLGDAEQVHDGAQLEHGATLRRSFRLKGMDMDNQTAYARGLMIHSSGWVNNHCWMRYIPLHRSSCQGCVTVSSKGMRYLWQLVNNEEKPLLLWSYYVE